MEKRWLNKLIKIGKTRDLDTLGNEKQIIKRVSLVLTLENFFAACRPPMLEALLHIRLIHLEQQNAEVYSQRRDWNKEKML